jgi:RNA polymerase sigma factor FliA
VQPARAEASLWRRLRFEAEAGCRAALFNLYVGLARALAGRDFRRRRSQRVERRDYEHFAYEGLLQAIDRFDPMRGVPFSAYARLRIAGNISNGISQMSEIDTQIGYRHRIEQERLRSLAQCDEMSRADVLAALSQLATGLALGIMLEGTRLVRSESGADPAPLAYESLEWRELNARLADELARLPANEALVLRQHYDNGLSFAQIAILLDLSRGRVSQLHKSALDRLRAKIGRLG